MDIASCSLPFFTIWCHRRAEEKRQAIDVPGLLGDQTECTCGFLFSPLWQFNCIFDINWSKGCCECTLGCHIDFRESLFFFLLTTPLLNLSRRAAVNFPHRQGGQLGGTGSLQQVLEFDTPSFLVISFSVARRKSSKPQELSVSIEMTVDTAYVTLSISHLSRKRGLNSY